MVAQTAASSFGRWRSPNRAAARARDTTSVVAGGLLAISETSSHRAGDGPKINNSESRSPVDSGARSHGPCSSARSMSWRAANSANTALTGTSRWAALARRIATVASSAYCQYCSIQ